MSLTLERIQGLIAGDGELPVRFAQEAKKSGFEVVAISLSSDNRSELKKVCKKVYDFGPGEIMKIREALREEKIKQITFLGKVHKGMLLKNPKLDSMAIEILKKNIKLNDDAIMQAAVAELEKEGIEVLDQTIFIKSLMVPKGVLTSIKPTEDQIRDIEYGYEVAKQIGDIDVGQSVVIKNKMILAIEAIEGTDKAIERGGKLGKKGSIVVKVSKPAQDKRFDIPTVGMNTLRVMKKYHVDVLAIESGETIIVQQEEMVKFAEKNKIVIIAV